MSNQEIKHIGGQNMFAIDESRPLFENINSFETWMKKTWTLRKWIYKDWRKTKNPHYDFEIEWKSNTIEYEKIIEGFITEESMTIIFRDHPSEYFILDFTRKYIADHPHQKDNICYCNDYGDISRYYDDLSDEELLARIRTEYLDYDLMKKVWGDDWDPTPADKKAWGGDHEPPRPPPKSGD
jgi:hypothetical protein